MGLGVYVDDSSGNCGSFNTEVTKGAQRTRRGMTTLRSTVTAGVDSRQFRVESETQVPLSGRFR